MEKAPVRRFQDLDTWNAAMDLAVTAYSVAVRMPSSERFELSAQIRRAAASVPSNVAEGHATGKDGIFLHHLRISMGSVGELDTLFELGLRLAFVSESDLTAAKEQLARTGQLLHGLIRSVQRKRLRTAAKCMALVLGPALLLFRVL